jgi:hydrogenase small subunit/[NiFe] hydrogenase small subunit
MPEMSVFPGVTRRDFFKICGGLAALIGLGQAGAAEVAQALEQIAKRPNVIWSDFQECLGCSVNLLQSRTPQVATLILQQISLNYHEAVMAAAGDEASQNYWDTVDSGDFYWVVEGSIATKIPGAMTVHGETSMDIVKKTYPKAKATIAIGSCACYGNVQAARPNPTGAKGLATFLKEDAGVADPVVINMSRCPGNAEDMLAALTYVLVYKKLPELDAVGRPVFLYGDLVHDNCERRAHFEHGDYIESFGDPHTADDWCWFKMGCKGPVTYAPCPVTRWNGHQSWCIKAGPCIGCSEPDFWDTMEPFYSAVPNINAPGIGGISDNTFTKVLVGATAVAIGAHLVGTTVTHRLRGGGPMEAPAEAAGEPPSPDGPSDEGGE